MYQPFIPLTRAPHGRELVEALALVPRQWRARVEKKHAAAVAQGREEMIAGNRALAATVARMAGIRIPLSATDGELCDLARKLAAQCMDVGTTRRARVEEVAPGFVVAGLGESAFSFDVPGLRRKMADFCRGWSIEPPREQVADQCTGELRGVADLPAIRRMTDHLWWRRALRKAQGRAIEGEAIRLGYVHKRAEIYVSDLTANRRAQQKARNVAGLENTTARNLETGDEFTLAELAARSNANPAIRRGELMIRLAGFEACAKALGHVGLFVTLTCPSRMHAKKTTRPAPGRPVQVFDNPKYDGTTPRQGQQYLVKLWARTRAALARAGAACYGFRIAEPHHDGAPHWHLLLFVAAGMKAAFCRIFGDHATREDRAELGSKAARAARFLVKEIDPAKGSACGYLAKYVSKNIDAYQVQRDFEGVERDAVTTAPRVDAWAAAWGIRQFQQIGGAPVGIWRELRRIDAEQAEVSGDAFAAAYAACNKTDQQKADFGAYLQAMGGPLARRADRPLELAKTDPGMKWSRAAGSALPCHENRYGETTPPAVFGVREVGRRGRLFVSNRYTWEIKRGANAARNRGVDGAGHGGAVVGVGVLRAGGSGRTGAPVYAGLNTRPREEGRPAKAAGWNRETGFEGFDFGRPAQPAGPWSPVNNCTQGEKEDGAANRNFAREGVTSETPNVRRNEKTGRDAAAGDGSATDQGSGRANRRPGGRSAGDQGGALT